MENEKAIWKMDFDCGRMGSLEGCFVAQKAWVKKLIESKIDVYFGEVLGKHSEIYGPIEEKDIKMVTDKPDAVASFEELELESGHNPFDYSSLEDHDKTVGETITELLAQEA